VTLTLDKLTIELDGFRLSADFEIAAGRRVALIGPSGAGKSTLLSVIAGFVAPASGRVLWQGVDLAGRAPGERPVSLLFQDHNLFPHLSVEQNVALGLRPDLRLSPDDRRRVAAVLARTGLSGHGAKRPGALSGGQQSRAALARALLRGRPLLLLDEPFSALGPALRREMLDFVAEIAAEEGSTVLLVSHEPGDALAFADETVLVAGGRAAAPAPTGPLFDDPPPDLAAYLG
jgi:thiamine transport system ATP-binding protein